ncbi:MAG: 6-carboxyhexanoate--CoA ligase [Desulfovibrio sp.]|nr:6-carboxyhexanoate--CoA ligase [Desulfovibrio sp.]
MNDKTTLFSIKMRASRMQEGRSEHISGAERFCREPMAARLAETLIRRALNHTKGKADHVNLKLEAMKREDFLTLPELPVRTISVETSTEGIDKALDLLAGLGLQNREAIRLLIDSMHNMRGAVLVDADTYTRLEPDHTRGVRATYMDYEPDEEKGIPSSPAKKDHYSEALVLASKVARAPGIVAELCISDDPDYVTGYVASEPTGYVRITKLKEEGDPKGGRLFFYRGSRENIEKTIRFLEHTPCLIRHRQKTNGNGKTGISQAMPGVPLLMRCRKILGDLERQRLRRHIEALSSAPGREISLSSGRALLFSSNDYLAFASNPQLKKKAMEAAELFGTGSGGSRLTSGTLFLHCALEEALAAFKHREDCILFATGYQANLGTVQALCGKDCVILSDALNHASIIDGARLSKAEIVVYAHNDMEDLEAKAREYEGRPGLMVSDAVFSMDGDILNLPEFLSIGRRHGFLTMIDEAHATGVIGKLGRGIEEYFGISEKADLTVGTLSKALGSEGGFVAGNREIIEFLRNTARSFIFSTSLSPAPVAAAREALRLLEEEEEHVKRLQDNIRFFKHLSSPLLPIPPDTGTSAIFPVLVGSEEKALHIAQGARERGLFLQAIRYPTVARGEARLRLTLRADHTKKDLTTACTILHHLLRDEDIGPEAGD